MASVPPVRLISTPCILTSGPELFGRGCPPGAASAFTRVCGFCFALACVAILGAEDLREWSSPILKKAIASCICWAWADNSSAVEDISSEAEAFC